MDFSITDFKKNGLYILKGIAIRQEAYGIRALAVDLVALTCLMELIIQMEDIIEEYYMEYKYKVTRGVSLYKGIFLNDGGRWQLKTFNTLLEEGFDTLRKVDYTLK